MSCQARWITPTSPDLKAFKIEKRWHCATAFFTLREDQLTSIPGSKPAAGAKTHPSCSAALALTMGAEAMVVMKDVCGLKDKEL
jgi:hypothetical protein